MTTINKINITGIRGTRKTLNLNLNEKSLLLYGENGTGKSSLTDGIEWFFNQKIDHLTNEEIDKKGKGAIRNTFISDKDNGFVEVFFNNDKLDAKLSIDNKLKITRSNQSDDFNSFIEASQSENLILRYCELVRFIIASKTDKLKELQEIIGFSKVQEIRELLLKQKNKINKTIKNNKYDDNKSQQQSIILENLERNTYTDDQFIDGINEITKCLKLGEEINTNKDVEKVLEKLKTQQNSELLKKINFINKVYGTLLNFENNVEVINEKFKNYNNNIRNLQENPEKTNKIQLLNLLKEGHSLLKNDVILNDICPLCQQAKNKVELIQELDKRIEELVLLNIEKEGLEEQANEFRQLVQQNINKIKNLFDEELFNLEENEDLKKQVKIIEKLLTRFSDELKKDLLTKLIEPSEIIIEKKQFEDIIKQILINKETLEKEQSKDIKTEVHTKIELAKGAYNKYKKIENEKSLLAKQQKTFEILYSDFIIRQSDALNSFLTMFSDDINKYYTAMNPNEKIEEIKFVPITKNEELSGITIEYNFFNQTKKPPIAYLSESHINCLGLAFFLASVKAFNKENKFFILDDIISSFDKKHRTRFAKLLTDNFSEYQIILLTHEHDFFELAASIVKNNGWAIKEIKWTEEEGSTIDETTINIKERILKKLKEKTIDGLGTDIRIYTEKIMKEIAANIEAPVAFRFNEVNEKRMGPELIDSIHSRISKKGKELIAKVNIIELKELPMFLENKTSHDNEFSESIEDLEVIWEDINNIINILFCDDCEKFISIRYFDKVEKNIRCSCGKLKYNWKK